MNWRTEVKLNEEKDYFDYNSDTLSIGSCFSSEIGERLKAADFSISVNPFGVIFNPVSLLQLLQNSLSGELAEEMVLERSGRYFHYGYHSSIYGDSKEELFKKISALQEAVKEKLSGGTHLFLTFGTAWAYRLKSNNKLVANCHKMPAENFNKELIDLNKLKQFSVDLFRQLNVLNPKLKIMLTVSPVRHKKDGLHENNLSKGVLHLFTQFLVDHFEQISYFPSYELIIDELRDYRFFKEDMLHPTDQAIDFILEKFRSSRMSQQVNEAFDIRMQLKKAEHHQSMHTTEKEKELHQKHIKKLKVALSALEK
ncbi:MAG: GSCFA domain-containing protein [Crocinitomicaceae bacterium]